MFILFFINPARESALGQSFLLCPTLLNMELPKMEVKIISSEMVTPSLATPSHLRKLTMSLLDQKFEPSITPVLLFYPAPSGATPRDIGRLKTCLSKTLTSFYPLAGRYQSWGTIICNDEGILFMETQVNWPLSSVVSSLRSSSTVVDLPSMYPPKDSLLASGTHLAIQINVFSCGGFAVGMYHTHKVTDGTSVANFLRYWAALVTERYDVAALAQADFSVGGKTFPPVDEENISVVPALNNQKVEEKTEDGKTEGNKGSWDFIFEKDFVRSFIFKAEAVSELKAKSVSNQVSNPSRFEAVAGFVWKSILLASLEEGPSIFNIAVDLRSRSDPPLPKVSMGNLFETALVRAMDRPQLPELVAKIHGSISSMKELASEYQGERRLEAKNRHWKKFIYGVYECKGKDAYLLTSWSKSAGFSDVDFGYGKPIWVIPIDDIINRGKKNTIILTEHSDSDGDGVEAWLFLGEKSVKFLESDPEFLAFASPNF